MPRISKRNHVLCLPVPNSEHRNLRWKKKKRKCEICVKRRKTHTQRKTTCWDHGEADPLSVAFVYTDRRCVCLNLAKFTPNRKVNTTPFHCTMHINFKCLLFSRIFFFIEFEWIFAVHNRLCCLLNDSYFGMMISKGMPVSSGHFISKKKIQTKK